MIDVGIFFTVVIVVAIVAFLLGIFVERDNQDDIYQPPSDIAPPRPPRRSRHRPHSNSRETSR